MEEVPCVPSPDCRYWNTPEGCHIERHHVYKRAEADTPLKKRFCRLGENVVRLCAEYHKNYEAENGWPQYPEPAAMKEATNGK